MRRNDGGIGELDLDLLRALEVQHLAGFRRGCRLYGKLIKDAAHLGHQLHYVAATCGVVLVVAAGYFLKPKGTELAPDQFELDRVLSAVIPA